MEKVQSNGCSASLVQNKALYRSPAPAGTAGGDVNQAKGMLGPG